MAMTINTNIMSLNAQRNAASNQTSLATSMSRLSSGLRVNSAKDDAAGLAIATRMDAQIRGMTVAIRNANDGTSLVQVAEGGLSSVTDVLQRMRELAVEAANGTNGTSDLGNLDTEFQQLIDEIDRVSDQTQFNGQFILGADAATFQFQIGANSGETISVTTTAMDSTTLGVDALDLSSNANASAALAAIDGALDLVNTDRATYGAMVNRFQAITNSLSVAVENQSAARGRIMDADFAAETANLSRTQILQQAGTAMIAQANQVPQNVLSLLK